MISFLTDTLKELNKIRVRDLPAYKASIKIRDGIEPVFSQEYANQAVSQMDIMLGEDATDEEIDALCNEVITLITSIYNTYTADGFSVEDVVQMMRNMELKLS